MKGMLTEYGIFIAELLVGSAVLGMLLQIFDEMKPVLAAGFSRFTGG